MAELETVDAAPDGSGEAPPETQMGSPDDPGGFKKPEDLQRLNKQIVSHLKARFSAADRDVANRKTTWKRNVDLRLGRPNTLYTAGVAVEDEIQSTINPDWSLTKTKTANLFSQLPVVQVSREGEQFKVGVAPFAKELNYELGDKRANTEAAMSEALNDMVNASGVAGVVIGYSARFETKTVPVSDEHAQQFQQMTPEMQQYIIKNKLVPMRDVQHAISYRFYTTRVSPIDLRTPTEFTGSDFNRSPWLGYRGRMSWADGLHELGLKKEQKDSAVSGQDQPSDNSTLRYQVDQQGLMELESVNYSVIYYWRHKMDPEEMSFDCIWKLVMVDGIDEPTIHEPWKGQKWNPQLKAYAGCHKFPIQVGTLTYISDNPIPPSDSEAGRPQVNDLRRSREQMFMNRDRSIPIRGFNSALVDPDVRDLLMKGDYQGMIPFNGNQKDAMWEVARASYPAEDLSFDRQTKADLMESWQVAPGPGDPQVTSRTASEVQINATSFSIVVGQERARVQAFFLNIVEVLAGLMALYSDFPTLTEEERQAMMQAWPVRDVPPDLVLSVRPDSMITMAPEQRMERLSKFLNLTVKSGMVNPLPILEEMTELAGLDPAKIIKQPDPPAPPEVKIALRLNGKGDMQNPFTVATMFNGGLEPTEEQINTAKKLLLVAQDPNPPPQPPPQAGPGGPGPGGPGGPPPPGGPPQGGPGSGPPPNGGPPLPGPLNQAHKNWSLANRIAKRSRDVGGGGNPGGET